MDDDFSLQVDIHPLCLPLHRHGIAGIQRTNVEFFERIDEEAIVLHPDVVDEAPEVIWILPDNPKFERHQAEEFIESIRSNLRRIMIGWKSGTDGLQWKTSLDQDAGAAYREIRSSLAEWYEYDFAVIPLRRILERDGRKCKTIRF